MGLAFEDAHVIVSGETAQHRMVFRPPREMWFHHIGVVNVNSISNMGIAILDDVASASIRWLMWGSASQQGAPLIYDRWIKVGPAHIIAGYIWVSDVSDRVRFWVWD